MLVPQKRRGALRAKPVTQRRPVPASEVALNCSAQNERLAPTGFDYAAAVMSTRKVKRGQSSLHRAVLAISEVIEWCAPSCVGLVRSPCAIARRDRSSRRTTSRGDSGFYFLQRPRAAVRSRSKWGICWIDECDSADSPSLSGKLCRENLRADSLELRATSRSSKPPNILRRCARPCTGRVARHGFTIRCDGTKVMGSRLHSRQPEGHHQPPMMRHLDMGLFKYALGWYGEDMVSLAVSTISSKAVVPKHIPEFS